MRMGGSERGNRGGKIPAATPGVCELEAKAMTSGLARALWRLDATHLARANALTLKPLRVRQTEVYRSQTIHTNLDFDSDGVETLRESTNDKYPAHLKRFEFPDLYDLQTALLYVRSQKLQTGQVLRIVVFPATTPYLATVTVLGREKIRVGAGSYPAIKIDLQLKKVTRDMKLEPHGKFKRGTGWISDDEDSSPAPECADFCRDCLGRVGEGRVSPDFPDCLHKSILWKLNPIGKSRSTGSMR